MKNYNKKILILLIAAFLFSLMLVIFSPYAGANNNFEKTITIREDGRISSTCTWYYDDYRTTWNMSLGTCFEDYTTIGDSGRRFEDGSAPYEYIEYVGVRNGTRSLTEWRDEKVRFRREVWKVKQEELKAMRIDKEKIELEKQISSIKAELEKLLLKLNNL